jgi:hypothetical protein
VFASTNVRPPQARQAGKKQGLRAVDHAVRCNTVAHHTCKPAEHDGAAKGQAKTDA